MTVQSHPIQRHVAVVGGGIMGAMTAHSLLESGARVTLYDPLPLTNSVNSSNDTGRSFRVHYGEDLEMMNMALESRAMWRKMQADAGLDPEGSPWFHPCGKLLLADAGDIYAQACGIAMRGHGLLARDFSAEQATERYGFQADSAVLDPYGGVLSPDRILLHLAASLTARGLIRRGRAEAVDGRWVQDDGGRKSYDAVVVTAGVWAKQLLAPNTPPIDTTRQQLVYFDAASALGRDISHLPVFSHMESGFYGIPTRHDGFLKIANHHPGPAGHPDGDDRAVDLAFINAARKFLARYHPALAGAQVKRTHVCFYTGTRDRDFILERTESGVILGTGFSGHGFKFAPLIGRTLAELALDRPPSISIERFASSRPSLYESPAVLAV